MNRPTNDSIINGIKANTFAINAKSNENRALVLMYAENEVEAIRARLSTVKDLESCLIVIRSMLTQFHHLETNLTPIITVLPALVPTEMNSLDFLEHARNASKTLSPFSVDVSNDLIRDLITYVYLTDDDFIEYHLPVTDEEDDEEDENLTAIAAIQELVAGYNSRTSDDGDDESGGVRVHVSITCKQEEDADAEEDEDEEDYEEDDDEDGEDEYEDSNAMLPDFDHFSRIRAEYEGYAITLVVRDNHDVGFAFFQSDMAPRTLTSVLDCTEYKYLN